MNERSKLRRRSSVRTRLTIAVGVVAAVFLGVSSWLLGGVTQSQVIASARDDQISFASSALLMMTDTSEGVTADDAAARYRELEAAGRVSEFYDVLGLFQPGDGESVIVIDDAGREVVLLGPVAGTVPMYLDAPTVDAAASWLLNGFVPSDLVVVVGDVAPATPVAGGAAPYDAESAGSLTDDALPEGASVAVAPTPGESAVVVPYTLESVDASVGAIGRSLWLAAAALTILAIGTTWLLAGRILRPVELITRRVEAIGTAGSGERVPEPDTRDEIGHLAVTMNGMLERLDHAADTQRRFAADASHELRSPLAVIRAEAEVALAHPDHADWPAVTRNILGETNRLEGLVADLLTLARQDQAGPSPRPAPVIDVEEVVMHEAARTRRVPIDTGRVLAGRVRAEPTDVGRMVRHLLDNAARHAISRVEVSLTTEAAGGREEVVLRVDDDGAGVPVADRDTIFERFARLQDSRSRDEGGAGLGLAVVASVVDGLHGTVTVADAPLGGARFEIRLPALPDG